MQAFERKCGDLLDHLIAIAHDSPDPKDSYLSRNVQWDSRVPEVRQGHFEDALQRANPVKRSTLRDALSFYKRNRVDVSQPSSFDRKWNDANEVLPGSRASWSRPPDRFGTIVNLSWQTNIFLESRSYPLFADFPPAGADPRTEADWFERKFVNQTDTAKSEFLDGAFEAIHRYRVQNGGKPVWVGEWDQIAGVLDRSPEEWLRFVGCEPPSAYPQLVVALQYGPKDGMPPLFRPTQLDSGDNHLHYPVPGGTEASIGGFALNLAALDDDLSMYDCTREWIHSPFLWRGRFFEMAGRRWGWTTGSTPSGDVRSRRTDHNLHIREMLKNIQPTWMPSPV